MNQVIYPMREMRCLSQSCARKSFRLLKQAPLRFPLIFGLAKTWACFRASGHIESFRAVYGQINSAKCNTQERRVHTKEFTMTKA